MEGPTANNRCLSLSLSLSGSMSESPGSQYLSLADHQACSLKIHKASCHVSIVSVKELLGPKHEVSQMNANCGCHQAQLQGGTCSSDKICSMLASQRLHCACSHSIQVNLLILEARSSSFFPLLLFIFQPTLLREQISCDHPQPILSIGLVHPFSWAMKSPHPSLETPLISVLAQHCHVSWVASPKATEQFSTRFSLMSSSETTFLPFLHPPPDEGIYLDGSSLSWYAKWCISPACISAGKFHMGWKRHPDCWACLLLPRGWCVMESRKQIALPAQVKILCSRWHNQSSHYFYCLQNVKKNKCLRASGGCKLMSRCWTLWHLG